ncbi:hypothetical protein [Ancylobacter dichloromethanicus]|uniref:hypothetical protein n=1 Tax=Ancylobacter dichloromethanicus TaxID=518825 RepID=UPI003621A352
MAKRLGLPHIDVDDFYWLPTDPPFSTKRSPQDRVRLIAQRQKEAEGWVLTGSFIGWGDALIESVDLIVSLDAYGCATVAPGRAGGGTARRAYSAWWGHA